jgi:hypothetical protein
MAVPLEREEYVEQAYFFRTFRERMAENVPAQDVLASIDQEVLSTTRLPMAIQFLATDSKHTGLLGTGFARLSHYFTPFQTFVVKQSEDEGKRFTMTLALMVLEREAFYRANAPTKQGLFVYQFETLCRNRLGYSDGLIAMSEDPFFDRDWAAYLETVRKQVGIIEFADLIYYRSEWALKEQLRKNPAFESPLPMLFGEKEGKIAKASRGRDPLFFFAALQRQLGYPEVPRHQMKDDAATQLDIIKTKLRDYEVRIKLLESEARGGPIDWSKFAKPAILDDDVQEIIL